MNLEISKHSFTYYPVACGVWEEGIFIVDEEEINLAIVKWGGEVVWLRVHD